MLPSVRIPNGTPISSWLHLIYNLACLFQNYTVSPPQIQITMSNQKMNIRSHIFRENLCPQVKWPPVVHPFSKNIPPHSHLASSLNLSTSWNSELLTALSNSQKLRSRDSGTPKMLAETDELRNTLYITYSIFCFSINITWLPGCQYWSSLPLALGKSTWDQSSPWNPAEISSWCCPWHHKETHEETWLQEPCLLHGDLDARYRVDLAWCKVPLPHGDQSIEAFQIALNTLIFMCIGDKE